MLTFLDMCETLNLELMLPLRLPQSVNIEEPSGVTTTFTV